MPVFGRRSMPPKTVPAFNYTRLCFGALLGSERRHPPPSLLDSLTPPAINHPPLSSHTAARPRTNALTLDPRRARVISGFPSGRRLLARALPLSHCGALPLFPSLRGSCSLRSRSPRHASTPRAEWPIRQTMTRECKRHRDHTDICGL